MRKIFVLGMSLILCIGLAGCNVESKKNTIEQIKNKNITNNDKLINSTRESLKNIVTQNTELVVDYGDHKDVKMIIKSDDKKYDFPEVKNNKDDGFTLYYYDDKDKSLLVGYLIKNNSDKIIKSVIKANVVVYDDNNMQVYNDMQYLFFHPELHPNMTSYEGMSFDFSGISNKPKISKIFITLK